VAAERQKTNTAPRESGTTTAPPKDKRAEYLTARQLSEVLQISEATVHRLRRTGRIPAVQLTDRLIRFNLRDVQKALKPQSTTSSSDHGGEAEEEPSPQMSFNDLLSTENDSEPS
jgi:excisionase family DNA binding protein